SETEEEWLLRRAAAVHKADTELPGAASRLSQMVLSPVAAELDTKRLLIVPDGALQYVPFSALPVPSVSTNEDEGARRQLVFNHEIVTLPSASTLAFLSREARKRTPSPKACALFADPVFGGEDDERVKNKIKGGFKRLRHTRKEAEAISAITGPEGTLQALDFEASRSAVLNTDLTQYRIVHFATHGLADSVHPELSGVVLSLVDEEGEAQDGFLRLYDIYNLRLSADLVVLSACRTALGKDVRGEGLVGLIRGFMYAGASRIVASLWEVDDVATAELMTLFYRGMHRGLPYAAALRNAQVKWLEQTDTNHSPFYWAAFTIQGEWHPPPY
ncbi:MAG TPA: CHAT domain-containing protein, partial [Pyrinomonadaceae bacterium]|nr:CHAT domain-containing protein [Pyrinomonadaceae bacterium]